jgi:putative membrane protein
MDPYREGASARFGLSLLALFALAAVALGIAPRYRQDWLLENIVVLIALPLLVFGWRRLRFSRSAYLALFAFLLLHEVGAHYTYSEVPYDDAFAWLTGHSLNALLGLHRNHFDRAVHFLYGLLVTPMAVELFAHRAPPRGVWRWILPVCFMMSHSVVYELVEWLAALRFGGELGAAYLGTQGDPWDAQQDMALAALGSVVSMAFLARRGKRMHVD